MNYGMAMLFMIVSFTGCKKDDNKDPKDEGGGNSYTFNDEAANFSRADYYTADGTVQIALYTNDLYNTVTFGFKNTGLTLNSIPEGTFTFNVQGNIIFFYSNVGGSEGAPLGYPATGGTVTINKSGEEYTLSFDISSSGGTAKGKYTGAIGPR